MNKNDVPVHILNEAYALASSTLKAVVIYKYPTKSGFDFNEIDLFIKEIPGNMDEVIIVSPPEVSDLIKSGVLSYINGGN
ncbi:MAG TPA: hypothetical protein VKR58_06390 [Aquella sp.]|nr:hypothetical protein [Aquella sp.]